MILRCAWCQTIMGEKEPLDDNNFTDGICTNCLETYFPHIAQKVVNLDISEQERYPQYKLKEMK